MVTAAGDRRMRRRGGRRQQPGTTPEDIGTSLREAREALGITLPEVQDRTGISGPQLEALEAGDLSRFPDQRSALTAVRRYADLTNLDSEPFVRVVQENWDNPLPDLATLGAGRTNGGRSQTIFATDSLATGHLSRYPGDGTHLRAFTQTAQVPGVRRAEPPVENVHIQRQFTDTGAFAAVPSGFAPIRAAPLVLRGAVWFTATLLIVALCALGVARWQPQLLKDIHVMRATQTSTPATPAATTRPGSRAHSGVVTESDSGNGSATISVRAANYSVRVAAWARCWTVVHTPQSFSPIFAATLPAGEVKDFDASNGQLTVSVSASLVTMQVRIGGKTVPGWVFKPTTVPFVLNFVSTTTS